MSENYGDRLAEYGGFDAAEFGQLQGMTKTVAPDYTGQLYNPIAYKPVASPLSTINPAQFDRNAKGKENKYAASELSAAVTRAQYADYEARFEPLEDLAIGLLRDQGTADRDFDVTRTTNTINTVFDAAQGSENRSRERFGLQGTGKNIAASNERASALVGGINSAKLADEQRRLTLLGGGVSSVAQAAGDS